jgi:AbrB family looped-hinge helix DNA binding protein
MAHTRFTAHLGERGRFVVPAALRKRLNLDPGDLVVIEEMDDSFVVRKATDIAHGLRGYLRDLDPGADLSGELLSDRREEAEREEHGSRAVGTTAKR